ncbi:hypothetical protein ACFQ60_00190 [Streptomyces zhihengii]|uniref:Uncharacterized protein n=1 Tax=Streptomyces zhihengii TaxID=1818004 RepID=A0ABS2V4Q3_9ACTN|nr:hypothetical protein [Streptomyces zhihengii]MBM9624821.1 hypothetical protein [Streptomyces zhihengii]
MDAEVLCLQDGALSKKSESFVVMMTLDRETSSVVLTRSDGKEARQLMGPVTF